MAIVLWDGVLLAAGLMLLFAGGEGLVRGSVAIAGRLRISRMIVGMVIVGFGTSTPELVVSLQAALANSPEISIGNVVGSNIANVLLILGMSALVYPILNSDTSIRREASVMLAVSAGLVALLLTGSISRLAGAGMLVLLAGYLFLTYRIERRRRESAFAHEADEMADIHMAPAMAAGAALAGLVMLMLGARFLVDGATGIARGFGVSEALIGLTIVAVGTSLPELATSLIAAWRKHADVALANIIGSNIFNVLAILGITALITPVPVASRFAWLDGPLMLATAVALTVMLFLASRLGRFTGLAMLAAYVACVYVQSVAA